MRMEETKKLYKTVHDKLWSLETRMDRMRRDQAESYYDIHFKLDALLRNSVIQDEADKVAEKTAKKPKPMVDFAEPQKQKVYSIASDPQNHRVGDSKDNKKRERIKFNESTKGKKRTRECSTRCHDKTLGKR